ncbi:MAG: hypothetical protein H6566_06085 [Lewinellaceae bacterium]|nr:hypothetical protein [Lewinellaceae bacterium]
MVFDKCGSAIYPGCSVKPALETPSIGSFIDITEWLRPGIYHQAVVEVVGFNNQPQTGLVAGWLLVSTRLCLFPAGGLLILADSQRKLSRVGCASRGARAISLGAQ